MLQIKVAQVKSDTRVIEVSLGISLVEANTEKPRWYMHHS